MQTFFKIKFVIIRKNRNFPKKSQFSQKNRKFYKDTDLHSKNTDLFPTPTYKSRTLKVSEGPFPSSFRTIARVHFRQRPVLFFEIRQTTLSTLLWTQKTTSYLHGMYQKSSPTRVRVQRLAGVPLCWSWMPHYSDFSTKFSYFLIFNIFDFL